MSDLEAFYRIRALARNESGRRTACGMCGGPIDGPRASHLRSVCRPCVARRGL